MTEFAPQCRLCFAAGLRSILRLPNSAGNISRMLLECEIGMVPAVTVEVYECPHCGFVQLTENLASTFYDDYLMTTSHSPQMQRYQQEQAHQFIAQYNLRGKRVADVGCGDGAYMLHLREAGAQAAGIEPSARFRQLALDRGLTVFSGYVTADTPVPSGPYEGFTTRQVLEHVPDPHDFLRGIRASLAPNAAGLIEVPCLEQALEHDRFYDFFPDHLNYFSQRTLRVALELNGFLVESVDRGMNGEYNVALVRRDAKAEDVKLQHHTDRIVAELRQFLLEEQRAGHRVAVWGAGGKGIALLATAQVAGVVYVVDSDRHKQSRFTPVTHLPIFPPEKLHTDPVDSILVTALAYRNEILNELFGSLGFRGKVAVLGPHMEVVNR